MYITVEKIFSHIAEIGTAKLNKIDAIYNLVPGLFAQSMIF